MWNAFVRYGHCKTLQGITTIQNENWFWHVVKLIISSLVSIIVSITISSHGIGFGLAFLDLAWTNLVTLLFLQDHLRVIAVCS